MRLPQSQLQKLKLGLHVLQALFVFVTWCITISIFTQASGTDGRTSWYFALCFITIPFLIYQTAVPLWSRSQRFANVYAFCAVDASLALFWLSALACIVGWTKSGIEQGAEDKKFTKDEDRTCAVFAYGSESACTLSYSVVGLGVVIFLLFLGTLIISLLYVRRIRDSSITISPWLSTLASESNPLYTRTQGGSGMHNSENGKDGVWDDSTGDIDDPFVHEDDARIEQDQQHNQYMYGGGSGYGPVDHTDTDDGRHPGRPWDSQRPEGGHNAGFSTFNADTGYRGGGAGGGFENSYSAPSALSPIGGRSYGGFSTAGGGAGGGLSSHGSD